MGRRLPLLLLLAACSGGESRPDACVAGAVLLQATSPTSYACHEPFKAKLVVQNGSCDFVSIRNITVVGNVTSGGCPDTAPAFFEPAVTTVAPGVTATILDVAGSAFCCRTTACPAVTACDETFDFTVATAGAPLNAQATSHLDLGGCDTICQ